MSDKPTTATGATSAQQATPEQQHGPDLLSRQATADVKSGMLIGIGAGRTASRGIRALAEKVKNENLDIRCVAASERAQSFAESLGLKVEDFGVIEEIDLLIDGADEIDREMRVMKGSRGAMTRERILCWASKRTIFMVTEDKIAQPQIGVNFPLPIAVMAYGLASTRRSLRHVGVNGVLRRDMDGQMFVTDNGNLVLDATLGGNEDLNDLVADLDSIPGVIDHGLFLDEADEILVEHEDGTIEHLKR